MSGSHCIIIPFLNRFTMLADCLDALEPALLDSSRVLLVDDGSEADPWQDPRLQQHLSHEHVILLQHDCNLGVAASRNTALHWCRESGIEIVIMLDSDCLPASDFVSRHLELHSQHADTTCIGAAIVGQGQGIWAQLDKVMSWVHAMPHGALRIVEHPYHLPTTNMSAKLAKLPHREHVFDERLKTGEDALLVRELRENGQKVLFSPQPVVHHRDREQLLDVFRHHVAWGHHQYFVQLGKDFRRPVFHPLYRAIFAVTFFFAIPLFAAIGSVLNLLPWLPHRPVYLLWLPAIYLLWLGKSWALWLTALRPECYIREQRSRLANSYRQETAA